MADITVDYNLPLSTGELFVFGNFSNLMIDVDSLTGTSHTFTNVQLPADGRTEFLRAEFNDADNCRLFVEIENSPPCSTNPICEIADVELVITSSCVNGGSDMDGANDYYEGDIIIYTANHPGSGTLEISCLLYTSPSPRDATLSRMPSSA